MQKFHFMKGAESCNSESHPIIVIQAFGSPECLRDINLRPGEENK